MTSVVCIAVLAASVAFLIVRTLSGGLDVQAVVLSGIGMVFGVGGLMFTFTFHTSLLPDRLEQGSIFSRKRLPLEEIAGRFEEQCGLFWVAHRTDPSRDILLDRSHLPDPQWQNWIDRLKTLDTAFMEQRVGR